VPLDLILVMAAQTILAQRIVHRSSPVAWFTNRLASASSPIVVADFMNLLIIGAGCLALCVGPRFDHDYCASSSA
jgi:hypothetical protein